MQDFKAFEWFVGHGVGTEFHTEPIVYHVPSPDADLLEEGQLITIEPSVTPGMLTSASGLQDKLGGAPPGFGGRPSGWAFSMATPSKTLFLLQQSSVTLET